MLTDAPPRNGNRAGLLKSNGLKKLDLPENGRLPLIAKSIESAMKGGKTTDVRLGCADFLAEDSSTAFRQAKIAFSRLDRQIVRTF